MKLWPDLVASSDKKVDESSTRQKLAWAAPSKFTGGQINGIPASPCQEKKKIWPSTRKVSPPWLFKNFYLYLLRQKENQTFHSGRCHLVAIYEFPETRQPLPRSSRCSFIPLIHQPAYFIPLQGLKLYRKREGFKLYVPHFDSYVLVLLPNT